MALNNIDIVIEGTNVNSWITTLDTYAREAFDDASWMADRLSTVPIHYSTPSVSFESVDTSIPGLVASKPTKPNVSLPSRTLPSAIAINYPDVTTGVDLPPDFTEPDPSINLPSVPDPLSISAPLKDFTLNLDPDFPIAPDDPLPSVPTPLDLDLPVPEDISIPLFDQDLPTSSGIVVPGITFAFSEDLYSSELLTKVKDELLSRLSGGTGINPVVEQAIYDRGRDRESQLAVLAERSLLEERSVGFSRPPGSVQSALDDIIQETQSKLTSLSRDIMIKQAELEQENIKTSIQQTIALEDILIREHNNVQQRAFDVARYVQDLAVEIYKAQVAQYNLELEAYKAFAQAYNLRVQAELSKIEIFKAQIDAEKLKGDINEQNIRIYLAQIDAVKTNVEIYKGLVSAVSEKLRAENLKIEAYKADIQAYSEQVRAKASEYSMYAEQIKGELGKVDIFDAKVRSYTSKVQAYSASNDILLKQADLKKDIEVLKIDKYKADLEGYIKQVQADQLIYQSAVDVYRGEAQLYLADIELGSKSAELKIKEADSVILQNRNKADIALSNAQISAESIKNAYDQYIVSRKAAGDIYSQIGGSAMNAMNVGMSVSGDARMEASESHNYSNA